MLRSLAAYLYCFAFFWACSNTEPANAGVIYDAAADFSATANSNGPWSYGYRGTFASSALTLLTDHGLRTPPDPSGIQGWWLESGSSVFQLPFIAKNFSSTTVAYYDVLQAPGQLVIHPYQLAASYAVIRWTAPGDGSVNISGNFAPLTTDGTTTDVHVVINGVSFFDGNVSGTISSPQMAAFSFSQAVVAGDIIDFLVGPGGNGFSADSTGIEAAIDFATPVPEPFSFATLLIAMIGWQALPSRLWTKDLSKTLASISPE